MPTLPTAADLGEASITMPSSPRGAAQYRPQNTDEIKGRAVAVFGNELAVAGEKIKSHNDTIAAEDAFNQLRQKQLDLTVGENGMVTKRGADAVAPQFIPGYTQQFDDTVTQLSGQLHNDDQRTLFNRRAQVAQYEFQHQLLTHAQQQQDVYAGEVLKNGIQVESTNAIAGRNNPSAIATSQTRIAGLIDAEADRSGWPQDRRDEAKAKAVSAMHTGVTEQFVADGNIAAAKQYLAAHSDPKTQIDTESQLHLQNLIHSHVERVSAETRVDIADKMRDIEAMGAAGKVPPPNYITDQEIQAAYGDKPVKAAIVTRQRDAAIRFANGAASLNAMDNDALVNYVKTTAAPSVSRPEDFALEAHHQEQLRVMAGNILTQRFSTPMQYAMENQVGNAQPIDFSKPEALSELANREQTSKLMTDRFGSPTQLLTQNEAGVLASAMNQMPATQKGAYLEAIRANVKDDASYNSVIQSIHPDSPVTALVGSLIGKNAQLTMATHWFHPDETMGPKEVGYRILEGEAILNPTKGDKATDGKPKFAMPSDTNLRQQWTGIVGDAYRGAPRTEETAYQAYKDFYAAEAARTGKYDGQFDATIASRAAKSVSGGVVNFNGKNVLPPWGMNSDTFYKNIQDQWPAIAQHAGLKADTPMNHVTLDTVGDGRYAVVFGNGPLRDAHGDPIVIGVGTPAGSPPASVTPSSPVEGVAGTKKIKVNR